MVHLLRLLAVTVLTVGCTGTSPYSVIRPPVHPLLEPAQIDSQQSTKEPSGPKPAENPATILRPAARSAPAPVRRPQTATRQPRSKAKPRKSAKRKRPKAPKVPLRPAPTGDRAKVLARLYPLIGQRVIGQSRPTDLGLINAAYADFPLNATALTEVRMRGGPVGRYPQPADLVFFSGEGGSPQVGIVARIYQDWVMDVAVVARNQVRFVRMFPGAPHVRRDRGRIYNSFIRRKRKTDRKNAPYLSAQLVVDYRSYFDGP